MIRRFLRALAALSAATLAVALYVVLQGPPGIRVTAYFTEAVGVYEGSDVRILGVKAGHIDTVRPEAGRVRVTLTVDHGVDVPAGARAVAIAPSLVSDRYIQLTPAYTGGARMADRSVIPADRTATPVEVDRLYDGIRRFADALGPNGLNRNGALADVLETGSKNLSGNGRDLGTTIANLGSTARTLAGSRDDLFGTVDDLRTFTTMLKTGDGQVRLAEQQLASVTAFLAADRQDLGSALAALAAALGRVKTFIQDNRAALKADVGGLAKITQILVDERASLGEALDVQPLNATNILGAYDPATKTLMGRGDLTELSPALPLPDAGGTP